MSQELEIIRDLARKVAELAHSEANQKKREMWRRHNSLEKVARPPVMCRPCGAWNELVSWDKLQAGDPGLKEVEYNLRMRLWKHQIGDDEVFEPWVDIKAVHQGQERSLMWGVNIDVKHSDSFGAFIFQPQINEEADIEKLRVPDWRVDELATKEKVEKAQEAVNGILGVRVGYGRLEGGCLSYWGAYLRGMEQMMYDCLDRPEWFHRFMKSLSEAHLQHFQGLEAEGHVTRNDHGYCNRPCLACADLPKSGFNPDHVRFADIWCEADAQEFALVSSAMWEEFLLEYQLPIMKMHGLVFYGCCESLVGKLEILRKKVPNLRRITVSPWSDLEYSARCCKKEVVMQIRPMPSEILMGFDEGDMRNDLEKKMEVAGDTIYEFCLQDIETVNGHPEILKTWTRIAKEVGAERYHR